MSLCLEFAIVLFSQSAKSFQVPGLKLTFGKYGCCSSYFLAWEPVTGGRGSFADELCDLCRSNLGFLSRPDPGQRRAGRNSWKPAFLRLGSTGNGLRGGLGQRCLAWKGTPESQCGEGRGIKQKGRTLVLDRLTRRSLLRPSGVPGHDRTHLGLGSLCVKIGSHLCFPTWRLRGPKCLTVVCD